MAEEQIEPRGQWRDDMRAGVVASVVANAHRDSKKRPKPYAASDFVLTFDTEEKQVDHEAIKSHAVFAFSLFGGVGFNGDNR